MMRWAGLVALIEEIINAYKIVIRTLERKTQLGKTRRGRNNNIQMDFRGMCCEGVHWVEVVQDKVQWLAFVDTVIEVS
jgi:hypothetical protein